VVLGLARNETTFNAAERVMEVLANVHLGITRPGPAQPTTFDMIPPAHRNWLVETTWEVVGRINAGQPEHDVISWWLSTNAMEG
jgi:hypothetical protein